MEIIPIVADNIEDAALGMLVYATVAEMQEGDGDGWVMPPDDMIAPLIFLETIGMAEQKSDEHGWWRATHKALTKTIYGPPVSRA